MRDFTLLLIFCCALLSSCKKEKTDWDFTQKDTNKTGIQDQILSDYISVENNRYTLLLTTEETQNKHGVTSDVYNNCKQNLEEINRHLYEIEQAGTEIILPHLFQ